MEIATVCRAALRCSSTRTVCGNYLKIVSRWGRAEIPSHSVVLALASLGRVSLAAGVGPHDVRRSIENIFGALMFRWTGMMRVGTP